MPEDIVKSAYDVIRRALCGDPVSAIQVDVAMRVIGSYLDTHLDDKQGKE